MITVEQADKIILQETRDFGVEMISYESALGRVLAEDVKADRDFPPFNRVTMDGIAVSHQAIEKGIRSFRIVAMQAAGEPPLNNLNLDECVEIMTGASLPSSADTAISYEEIEIANRTATVLAPVIKKGQNIHFKGKDIRQDHILLMSNTLIDPVSINIAASVGANRLCVKKLPRVVVVSTGNELVDVDDVPNDYQVRRSNSYMISAALKQYGLHADLVHFPDDPEYIRHNLQKFLDSYDVIILSGGVSKGKFDYIPSVLEELKVNKLFHQVQQRPGKPFWFGNNKNGNLVFAFPGNPVSTYMCLYRYFIPWLERSLCLNNIRQYGLLLEDVSFNAPLQYFLQVKVTGTENGTLMALPVEGNGSGDFINLLESNAFMELPLEQNNFIKGSSYRIWPFKRIV